ncbi:histone deacetylase 15-like isoform X3 [Primulina huaijiensis]|uniref:histone deacetylase 15-like isoform X3 n=1 Tax=Primulina huaijiensis TaxID=1492673 RepID=UPI003CC783CE
MPVDSNLCGTLERPSQFSSALRSAEMQMNHRPKRGNAENRLFNGDSESNYARDEQSEDAMFTAANSHFKKHSEEQENGQGSSDVTLEDMYNNNYEFEDDEDDDSDWEPSFQAQNVLEIAKWFCVNCTIDNFATSVHCEFCGEHRQSGIIKYGFLASAFSAEEGLTVSEADATVRLKGIVADSQTAIGFDERMLLHEEVEAKTRPHSERPDRLRAIAASLAATGIFPGRCSPILAREITREELQMVHSLKNIDAVELTSHLYSSYFTPDTYANQYSACAARLAAGLCFDLATSIYSGSAKNGFALIRPPGHHACVKQAMGFCLHNNAAIAASAAQRAGAKKVLIIDWDVHHGNGTQEIFEKNKSVLYVSLHRHEGGRFYPGTGAADEVGTMDAEGYCVNIPWSCGGVGDNDYIFAFQQVVMPIASEFDPDFTIISAGFDAARGDPLGCCDVTPTGYAQMTQMCSALSGGKLLVILEGGYNLRSISSSATAVVKVLLGDGPEHDADQVIPTKAGLRTVLEVLQIQMKYWPSLEPKYLKLESECGCSTLQDRKLLLKRKRRCSMGPTWWKWGRRRWLYRIWCKNFSLNHFKGYN